MINKKLENSVKKRNVFLNNHIKEIIEMYHNNVSFEEMSKELICATSEHIKEFLVDYFANQTVKENKEKKSKLPLHQQGFSIFCDKILFTCYWKMKGCTNEKS